MFEFVETLLGVPYVIFFVLAPMFAVGFGVSIVPLITVFALWRVVKEAKVKRFNTKEIFQLLFYIAWSVGAFKYVQHEKSVTCEDYKSNGWETYEHCIDEWSYFGPEREYDSIR